LGSFYFLDFSGLSGLVYLAYSYYYRILAILSAIDNPASAAGLLESSASKETFGTSFLVSTGSS
jgi:hypothetical protein